MALPPSTFASLIDYAGLFPPAALPMQQAVENYARYRASPEAWMLGRFVLPANRLPEFERWCPQRFPLSLLLASPAELPPARDSIVSVELKATHDAQIQPIPGIETYFEIADLSLIPVIAHRGARAKIRAGGVTIDAFPPARFIADFLATSAAHRVPFKATAGLHHALRCHRPLTYSADSPSGWMFGFLNVFIAAALAWKGVKSSELESVLMEESLVDHGLSESDLATARRDFAISFGSCSFDEPVADLTALDIL